MNEGPAPRRPALVPAMAFVAGVCLGEFRAGLAAIVVAGLTAAVAAVGLGGRRLGALLASTLLLCGAWSAGQGSLGETPRLTGWVPADESPVALSFVGVALDAPERERNGDRRLLLEGSPEVAAPVGSASVCVQLRVLSSPADAMRAVDSLRRGDLVRVWCTLRPPRRPGDPDLADPRRLLRARAIDAVGAVKSARLVRIQSRGSPSPARALSEIKALARSRLDRCLGADTPTRAVLGAMLLGDRSLLDPSWERALRDSGLIHLLSISGLHVGLIVIALIHALLRLRLGPWAVLGATALSVGALAVLVGAQPPVVRSALSASLLLCGRALGRDGDSLNTLAVTAAAMAVFRPAIVGDIGFQLTFAATAGLLSLAGPIARSIPLPRPAALSLGVSAGAYLVSIPLVVVHFGRVVPVALVTNLTASVLCGAALASGGGILAFADVPAVGPAAVLCGHVSVAALLRVSEAAVTIPGGTFRTSPPSGTLLSIYYLSLLVAWRMADAPGRHPVLERLGGRLVRLIGALSCAAMHVGVPPPAATATSEVAVLDVGQAQAVVFRGPSGGFVVVDAGGTAGGRFDAGERIVAPFLARRGCRRIETLIVTHGHDDHAGGGAAIVREFEVAELWITLDHYREREAREILTVANARGTAIRNVGRGTRGNRAGFELEVLHPRRRESGLSENDGSLAVRLGAGSARVLVPGDLERQGESRLLEDAGEIASDILVIGHHGARGATSDPFLDAVAPGIAVISVGAWNRFGHPDPDVLRRLASRGIRTYRTDRDGRIVLRNEAGGWRVERAVTESEWASE